jgi:hypothetical protein
LKTCEANHHGSSNAIASAALAIAKTEAEGILVKGKGPRLVPRAF